MVAFSCNKTCSALKLELFACALLDHFWLVSLVLRVLVVSPQSSLNLCKIVFLPVYFLLVFFISVTIAVFDLVGSPI